MQASHLILSNIYESKEMLEHMLQSMTKQKTSFLSYHPYYTHPSNYLQLSCLLQGFIRILFTTRIYCRQVTTPEVRPHLEEGAFRLLPWALPPEILQCCSSAVTSTATNLQRVSVVTRSNSWLCI